MLEYFRFNEMTKAITKSGDKEDNKCEVTEEVLLSKEEATGSRGAAPKMNYYAADCLQILYAVKEVCRDIAKETVKAYEKVKKLARYVLHFESVVWEFVWDD